MKKIIVFGAGDGIFRKVLEKAAFVQANGLSVEFMENEKILREIFPELKEEILLFVNQNEVQVQKIKNNFPNLTIMACHGSEKRFQPVLTWVDQRKNNQHFWYEGWPDFLEKLKNPPFREHLPFSAFPADGQYRINYDYLPEIVARRQERLDQNFFWFEIFISRIYLAWFKKWLKEVNHGIFNSILSHESWKTKKVGQIKRLVLPFPNVHLGELIFREGGKASFGEYYEKHYCHYDVRQHFIGKVISAGNDGITVEFEKPLSRADLDKIECFYRGGDLLSLSVSVYAKICADYSDFSLGGPSGNTDSYYYQPEAYLRGYIPNLDLTSPLLDTLDLRGKARQILQDDSQCRALADILQPTFVSVVQGPPGTGKTFLTAVAIKQFLRRQRIVLVLAHSNQGLDNLLLALMEHVQEKSIFRLGNETTLISGKTKKLHRKVRYKKQVERDSKKEKKREDLLAMDLEVAYETEEIWRQIASGQGVVLGVTVNSFEFDETLRQLFFQNSLVNAHDFSSAKIAGIPAFLFDFMEGKNAEAKPRFAINVGIVDEATKGFPHELLSIVRRVTEKLILVGDTRQLGNIKVQPQIKAEVERYIYERLHFCFQDGKNRSLLMPNTKKKNGLLLPIETNMQEIEDRFRDFSEGIFYYLSKSALELDINRRSLPEIVHFINAVFNQNFQVGRFNPYEQGKVLFLDVSDSQEKKIKTSFANSQESGFVAREMINFFKKQKKQKGEINFNSLGVIAMYRSQVTAIKEKIRNDLLYHRIFAGLVNPENVDELMDDMINTVDAFQGSEREMIIISLVRSNKEGETGFSSNIRRFYVALTRARDNLIIIGNAKTFLADDEQGIFQKIISYTTAKSAYFKK